MPAQVPEAVPATPPPSNSGLEPDIPADKVALLEEVTDSFETVWRDFNGDFGEDLLAQHYRNGHGK